MSPPSVVLFDGVCNLCCGFVQFVVTRDRRARFRFAALQSSAAAALVSGRPLRRSLPDSVVLAEGGRVFTQSTAVLRVVGRLGFPWSLMFMLLVIPAPVRDAVYNWVARNRYAWFGKRDECMVPTPDIQSRFLQE